MKDPESDCSISDSGGEPESANIKPAVFSARAIPNDFSTASNVALPRCVLAIRFSLSLSWCFHSHSSRFARLTIAFLWHQSQGWGLFCIDQTWVFVSGPGDPLLWCVWRGGGFICQEEEEEEVSVIGQTFLLQSVLHLTVVHSFFEKVRSQVVEFYSFYPFLCVLSRPNKLGSAAFGSPTNKVWSSQARKYFFTSTSGSMKLQLQVFQLSNLHLFSLKFRLLIVFLILLIAAV